MTAFVAPGQKYVHVLEEIFWITEEKIMMHSKLITTNADNICKLTQVNIKVLFGDTQLWQTASVSHSSWFNGKHTRDSTSAFWNN